MLDLWLHVHTCVYIVFFFNLNHTASGDGEKIMQFCPSFHIVQLMREGNEPQKACEMVIKMMTDRAQKWFEVAVIALNTKVSLVNCGVLCT